jgi:hypothetical protein
MAAAELGADELRELCVELAATLTAVVEELDSAGEGEWPLPDEIEKGLRERAALAAALKAAPAEVIGKLRTIFVREMDRNYLEDPPTIHFPIQDAMAEAVEETMETLRRATLRDSALHPAIGEHRDLPFGVG